MHLAEFIRTNHEKIIAQWVEFAGTMLPWAEGMDDKSLRDHAEELLTAVVNDMLSPQSRSQKYEKSKGSAFEGILAKAGREHASGRLECGFNLTQLVSEFRALRASVLRLWEDDQGEAQGEVTRFNEAIDGILAISTTQYAETVQNTRDQFLGILGHDLRNPLGAVTMGASLLARSDDAMTRDIASRILGSGERMNRMVNDLLDLTRSRLGAGIPVERATANLAPICRQVVSEFRAGHPRREIRFESLGTLRGEWDCDRLAQALSNLVANALQHGDLDSPVSVEGTDGVDGDEAAISLRVHNVGPAISEVAMRTIFDPMSRHRHGGSEGENPTGLGLGLFIVSEIVSAHGGTIGVTSTVADGTTFTVKLPRTASSSAELRAAVAL